MKRSLLTLSLVTGLALAPSAVQAGYGFFNNEGSFVIVNKGGAGNVYYFLSPASGGPLHNGAPQFDTHSFGSYTKMFNSFPGQSLVLNGFENNTFSDSGDDVFDGSLAYRIYKQGTAPGSFNVLNFGTNTVLGGGDERHEITNASINLLSNSYTPGTYVLELYTQANVDWTDGGSTFDDLIYPDSALNLGNVTRYGVSSSETPILFKGTFVVSGVPEPSTAVLFALSLGALRFIRRKKLA